jgi:hypothetical protein
MFAAAGAAACCTVVFLCLQHRNCIILCLNADDLRFEILRKFRQKLSVMFTAVPYVQQILQQILQQNLARCVLHDVTDTAAAAAAAAAPSEAEAKRRARFSLLRCDAYHCEREQVKNGMISFTNPATNQVMLVWEERPRRVLVLVKVHNVVSALVLCIEYAVK